MTSRQQNIDAVVTAVRQLVESITDHRAGGIGAGPTVATAQQNLRDVLRNTLRRGEGARGAMTATDEPLDLKLARKARDEAEQHRAAAAKDLLQAQYLRDQAARDRREIAEIEVGIRKRAEALRKGGEPEFIARMAAADKALAEAKALMAAYSKDKAAAAIYLRQCLQREQAERQSAA
jgi:hypothetical protein